VYSTTVNAPATVNVSLYLSLIKMGGAKEGLAGASAPPRGGIAPP